jgi:hypothetical protein
MKLDELPRKAVLGYLELARYPLTAAERALGRTEGTWAPTLAADRFQARIKETAGRLLKDDVLVADAKLQTTALDERIKAAQAEAEAERIRRQADAQLRKEQRAIAEAKREVAKRDELRERAVETQVKNEKAAVRATAANREKVVAQREKTAKRASLDKEATALNEERAAAEAKAEVLELEDKLNGVEAARKSG